MPAVRLGLTLTDPSGTGGPTSNGVWPFRVADEDGGKLLSLGTTGRAGQRMVPFNIDLLPMLAGLGPGAGQLPGSYTRGPVDSSYPDALYPGPARTALTLTSALQQGTMAVQWNGYLWILAGRYVYRISDTYAVQQNRDLGASAIGTWLSVVGGELFVCCGQSAFIQKQTVAGAWSTSADVRAFALQVVRHLVWRLGGAASGVDNAISTISALGSSVATNAMSVANYNTAAGYYVGDASYQAHSIVDYGGVPWVGRPDGVFSPDPETKFLNQTPQVASTVAADNCRGMFTAWGSLWVPTNKGLLRVEPGNAIRVGPETNRVPAAQYYIYGGVEWDRCVYLSVYDLKAAKTVIMKMEPDDMGAGPSGEYVYTPLIAFSVDATNFGRFIAAFSLPTNPTLVYGGGTAVDAAGYSKLGRHAGGDVWDANYEFSTAAEVTTGRVAPGQNGERALLEGTEIAFTTIAAGQNVVAYYGTGDEDAVPATTFLDEQESGGGSGSIASGASSPAWRYAAPGAVNTHFNFRLALPGSGTNKTKITGWRVWGKLLPKLTDEVELTLVVGSWAYGATGVRQGYSPSEALDRLRSWCDSGTVLTGKLPGYEEERTTRFVIRRVGAKLTTASVDAGGKQAQEWTVPVTLERLDYADAYAD